MNKLLNRTLLIFSIYALLVLAASIPAYHYLVDGIWLKELDEHNQIIALRTEHELNAMRLDDEKLGESILLWNSIQPGTSLKPIGPDSPIKDSIFIELRQNPYLDRFEIDRFRGLRKLIKINGKHFLLTVETNVEETEETVAAIAIVTLIFFLILVFGFLLLNRRLSKKLWKPFRIALKNLQEFNLNHQKPILFPKTNIYEFQELNHALEKLISHNITVYKGQKEFTENVSHELQTPLSIIKGKLNLLLQDEPITQRQYRLIEEIDSAISRIAKINRNLLLLAKIENHQFDESTPVDLSETMVRIMSEMSMNGGTAEQLDLSEIPYGIEVSGNQTLTEILLGNLLSNAIRYNLKAGKMWVSLDHQKLLIRNSGNTALAPDKIFNRFSTTNQHGSGLGLAIVKEICLKNSWNVSYYFSAGEHCFEVSFWEG